MHKETFPDSFKIAQVIPIPKVPSSKSFDDLRPISLPAFAKIFKKILETKMSKFSDKNKIITPSQFGFMVRLAEQFTLILEKAGVYKSFSLYKERRFTRLGYQAGAVYDCIPYIKQLLDVTPLNNLLVRACKIYLENDFIRAGLKALEDFTYRVTMPFLNCVERANQDLPIDMLPKLCSDLAEKETDTLRNYHVEWTHVDIEKNAPHSDLDHLLLEEMCIQAAKGVELQCKREYCSVESENARATPVYTLAPQLRQNSPTNNLNAERYLARFGYFASQSAKHSNKMFKAKRIKDDLMLTYSQINQVERSTETVLKHLDAMDKTWE